MKNPFGSDKILLEIDETFPTLFYLYDEEGIRRIDAAVKKAFSWNSGYREYFAVKAAPNPYILKLMQELGNGLDCSSYTELLMAQRLGFPGEKIMFSSNDTPAEDFVLAKKLNAIPSSASII
jgi:diaminopimelate decarboxylase